MQEVELKRIISATGGQKIAKLARYDLIPVQPLRWVAERYGLGAEKYDVDGKSNWRLGYPWSQSEAALMRHFEAWRSGEDMDTDSFRIANPHLAAVVFHANTLMEWSETHPEYDDRVKR